MPDSRVVDLGIFPNQSAFFEEYLFFDAELARFKLEADQSGKSCVRASASRWYIVDYLSARQISGKQSIVPEKKQEHRQEGQEKRMMAAL